ncbi:hemagglutinin repeat-containing protein, partial [Hafnia psychrotolerans]|uniref:hemagglutinin repeat-containing protein n=1 Tax=Hafnia psychrotolerans TaxID=1477018 RepID=UPI0027E59C38
MKPGRACAVISASLHPANLPEKPKVSWLQWEVWTAVSACRRWGGSRRCNTELGVGVGFGLGGQQNGFTIELSASGQKGIENGTSLSNQNSHITASDRLNINSGGDTTLTGAVLNGGRVQANVGGNLTISSVQDTATYDSKDTRGGINVSICVPPICAGQVVAGNANLSQQILKNNYASVNEQSGINAGDGGYHIIVKDHTQLDGAVIASQAPADKNTLETGTLGWRDIANVSDYQGSGYSVSVSTNSVPTGGLALSQGDDKGTTAAAVSPGMITITDAAHQQQDVATLSRDTDHANGKVSDGFDQGKIADRLELQREAVALSVQTMGAVQSRLKADKEN